MKKIKTHGRWSLAVLKIQEKYQKSSKSTYLKEEDIGALHAGVEDLRGAHLLGVLAAHDGAATLDARKVVDAGHVHHQAPVLLRVGVDLVRGPQEPHVLHVHACE